MGIRAEHISYVYNAGTAMEETALRDVSFEINDGEFVGLIGHTGCGKSTLIQHLNGLLHATGGDILFNGKSIYSDGYQMKDLRGKVGLVFQYPEHQLFEADVLSDVCFGPRNLGCSETETKKRALHALKMVGLEEELYGKSPFELSGGQKRRVAIAGVLAMRPQMMILDEPTAGLDPQGRDEILDQVARLNRQHGLTILVVSHSMEDMARYVDRLLVMNHGGLVYDGTPKEIFSRAEELKKLELDVPQVTELAWKLRQMGIPLPEGILHREELVEALLALRE